MFRNQYDSDVTVWSPQGRLHQVEYAMEAVKQGSATLALKSARSVLLVALKRSQNELTAHQKKIQKLDGHLALSMAGLLSDGRILARNIEAEAIDHRYAFNKPLPLANIIQMIEDKSQARTQGYGSRPFGVGLLIAALDAKGPHIVQTCPSGLICEYKAAAIGARSQSARTYLQRHIGEFAAASDEELIQHGLLALRETLPNDANLDAKNTSIALLTAGPDGEAKISVHDDDEDEALKRWIEALQPRPAQAAPADEAAEAPAPMDQ